MSTEIPQATTPATTPAAPPLEQNHISLDDLKKIRGGVGEPAPPRISPVEKSDEDFPAQA